MIEYATLRLIWWALLGILLIGFAVMDGFDFGAAMLLPFVGKSDVERRIVINTFGPVWEGNQIWLVLGAGAIFAAWPSIYAVAFSGLYLGMLLALAALIIRPVAIKYRSKLTTTTWRSTWDTLLSVCSLIAPLVFGLAVGNVLQGVPFHFDRLLRSYYTGSFWALFNPFALLCAVISVLMCCAHGGIWLTIKTEDPMRARAQKLSKLASFLVIVLFAIAGFWVAFGIKGYVLVHAIAHNEPSNPLTKQVSKQMGAWLFNYQKHPLFLVAPTLGFLGFILSIFISKYASKLAFICSGIGIAGIIATVGISMFPFLLPSSANPQSSLLIWDASSSQLTLTIMLIATIIFLPIILLYTTWVYRVLRGKITEDDLKTNSNAY